MECERLIKISLIVPVYNVREYLSRCLDSILSQTLDEIEVICVEDGSTDGSRELLHEYEIKDKRIIGIFNDRNMGLPYSRNRGLAVTKGQYVWFVDSDDFIVGRDALERLYEVAEKKNTDVLTFNMSLFFEGEELRKNYFASEWETRNGYNGIYSGEVFFAEQIHNGEFMSMIPTYLYKRSFLMDAGLKFPLLFHEDLYYSVAVLLRAKRVTHVPEAFYGYYRRSGSITVGSKFRERLIDLIDIRGLLIEYLDNVNLNVDVIKAYETYIFMVEDEMFRLYFEGLRNGESFSISSTKKKVVFDVIGRRNFPFIWENIDCDFCKKILENDSIVLYGAGAVSQSVKKALSYLGRTNYTVATTGGKSDVKALEDLYHVNNDSLVIIAATGDKSNEMKEYALKLGFSKVVLSV